jgi:hypothetical protein
MASTPSGLELSPTTVATFRARLPGVAERTVSAIVAEVPSYAEAFGGPMGETIRGMVEVALAAFLTLASGARGGDPGTPLAPALEGAYALGRGEARSGRSLDALLSAYRVGARVAWRELADEGVALGLPAPVLVQFAELVFAYIDQLSASSVAGHADELAVTGRVRERYLDRLGRHLLAGDPEQDLLSAAERADWAPPRTLTAVLLPQAQVHALDPFADPRTLRLTEDLPGLDPASALAVLLVPDAEGRGRPRLLRAVRGRDAVVGPARPWQQVASSYRRVLRSRALPVPPEDTEEHLPELVLTADPEALADLRAQVLAPLAGVRASSADKLEETLRCWLLHQGRRDDVAAALFVHPQTVRYRMTQLRELYGDRLRDPQTVLALTVALGVAPG